MYIYYGYESMVKLVTHQPILKISRPNGSNCYYYADDLAAELEAKLPKSHVPLLVPEAFNRHTIGSEGMTTPNVAEFSHQLKDILNFLISPPGSMDRLIHQITYENGFYGAVYLDGRPVTLSERQLNIILNKLKSYLDKKVVFDDEFVRINESCFLYDEPIVITLPVSSFNQDHPDLHLEYLARIAFIKLATFNQWLKPYAHRVSFKRVGESGSIMLPVWGDGDIEMAYDLIDTPLPPPLSESINTDVIILYDDKRYPLPDILKTGYTLPAPDDKIDYRGERWDLNQVRMSRIPDVDWRLHNLAKIADVAPFGYVPFAKLYPEHLFAPDSADRRIKVYEDAAGVVVTLEPEGIILGSYSAKQPGTKDFVTAVYKYLWQNGYLLTNYGHYMYVDDLVTLDEVGVRKLNLTLDDLRVVAGKINVG